MSAISESDGSGSRVTASAFATTHWNVVLAVGDKSSLEGVEALETLCRTYWRPLYGYLRRNGTSPHDAQDCIQGFFADLLRRDSLTRLDRAKGKFRSFLLAALKHFLANQWDHARAAKRGGEFSFVSWEDKRLESLFPDSPSAELAPDKAFERSWSMTLLEQVLQRLRQNYVDSGKGEIFDALQVFLTGDKGTVSYGEIADRLHLSDSAVKMSIQRLRRRFGELLRDEIAHTVSKSEEIDEEIRALFAAVRY